MDTMEHTRRKRPRNEADNSSDPTDTPDVQRGPISRDETYYRADGDYIIRVGDVLFKVRNFQNYLWAIIIPTITQPI